MKETHSQCPPPHRERLLFLPVLSFLPRGCSAGERKVAPGCVGLEARLVHLDLISGEPE